MSVFSTRHFYRLLAGFWFSILSLGTFAQSPGEQRISGTVTTNTDVMQNHNNKQYGKAMLHLFI